MKITFPFIDVWLLKTPVVSLILMTSTSSKTKEIDFDKDLW